MYCVVDLGSTKTEINLFSDDLCPLDRRGFETPFRSEGGAVFIEPAPYFAEIISALEALLSRPETRASARRGFGLTVTGMGSTVLAAEGGGGVIVPALSWEFRAPGAEIRDFPVSRTGKVLLPTYPLYKIAWMRERCGGRNPFFVSLPDYVLAGFLGFRGFHTDYSFASRSLLFDDAACDWDDGILAAAGVGRENLPVLLEAGTRIGPFDPSLRKRLGLPGSAGVYAGMHDHPATVFLGSLEAEGEDVLVNPAGTTESAAAWSADAGRRADLVRSAPERGVNTESAWTRDTLALVAYPTLSGKILDTARGFGVLPPDSPGEEEPPVVAVPSRRRLVVEDRGFVRQTGSRKATFDDFWKAVILSTQFEFRRALEDMELLLERKFARGVLLFGGQAHNEKLCRLKAAASGRTVVAYPGVNGAAVGAAARIAGIKPDLDASRRVFEASDEDLKKFDIRYRRYRETCENVERKEAR